MLYEDPVNAMEAATRQWTLAQIASGGLPEAPGDGQIYGRNGLTKVWAPALPIGGGVLNGPLTLYGNARLIVYDDQFKLQPDILESYDVKDNKEFTFHLRAGHRWSDGEPFTTERFV